ncbi:MAG: TIGR02186 family protein [Pseudomonadota bacterium]
MKRVLTTGSCLVALALVCAFAASAGAAVVATPLPLELNKKQINMDMTYSGENVVVSGAVPAGSQVAIVVTSKDNPPLTLTRKGKVAVFWMGIKQLEVCNMPSMYQVYTSAPLAGMGAGEELGRLNIGYDNLRHLMVSKCVKGEPSDDDADVLYKGYIRLKEKAGLYSMHEAAVKLGPDGRFEQAVAFPDKAAEGGYVISAYVFKDGALVASGSDEVVARKVGLGKWLAITAKERGGLYGSIAVLVALAAGLGVGAVFKKGSAH